MKRVIALALCVMMAVTNHGHVYAAENNSISDAETAVEAAPPQAEEAGVGTVEMGGEGGLPDGGDSEAGASLAVGDGGSSAAADEGPEDDASPATADGGFEDDASPAAADGEENDVPVSETADQEEPMQIDEADDIADEDDGSDSAAEDEVLEVSADEELFSQSAGAGMSKEARTEAQQAFAELAASKNLLALIYLTDAYEVREAADGESAAAAVLGSGHTVYVKGVRITKEQIWYYVSFWQDGAERYGYVEESYLAQADEDWTSWRETYLLPLFGGGADAFGTAALYASVSSDVAAFPATYQEKLQKLKEAHPNWIFVPVKTGLDFNTAVNNEMGDKSWISDTPSSRDAGYVGKSVGQSTWCYATEKAVSYYMDTRNYLDDTHIFAFEQLNFNSSYHSEEAVQKVLNSTFMKGNLPDENRTYANAFFTIGQAQKASPVHLAARVYQEQGKGTSQLISGTYPGYEGYYNYFNIGATGSSNEATIRNGLEYAKKKGWSSVYKSLSGGAAFTSENYIAKGQDTVYLQKFNVAPGAGHAVYTHQYMQNIQAAWSEASTFKKIYNGSGILDRAFVFKIPTYEDMPNEVKTPLEKIELNKTSLVLRRIGTVDEETLPTEEDPNIDSFRLEVILTPADTTDDTHITWKSSDLSVAVVSEDGTVTSVNKGTAVITATASKAVAAVKPSASCEVKVIEPPKKAVKCSVTFRDETGTGVLKTVEELYAGALLREADFPDVSTMEAADGRQFMGWYTEPDGGGQQFSEETPVYEPETVLYPYFAAAAEGFIVAPVGRQYYTGSAVKPVVKVYDAEAEADASGKRIPLVQSKDYTVSYKHNKKVSTAGGPQPVIIVKGKGNYTGRQELYFDILPVSLKRSDIRAENVMAKYSGKVIKSSPVVMCGTKKLVKGTDYTLSYPETRDGAYKQPGVYSVVITGKGGYTGEIKVSQIITKGTVRGKKSISKASVTGVADKAYTGNAEDVKQKIEVSLGGQTLVESTDGVNGDYIVVYKKINKAGTASIELHGIGDYKGTCKKTFKIVKADLQTLLSQGRLTVDSPQTCPYVKGKTAPKVKVAYTGPGGGAVTLTEGVDYTLSYKNNTRITADPSVINIKGKGNFAGTISKQFVITDGQFENESKLTVEAKDVVYKEKAEFYRTTVSIIDENDKALKAGTDYVKEYEYFYAGVPMVKDEAGNPVDRKDGDAVEPADRPEPGTVIRVRVKAMGPYMPADGHEAFRDASYRIIAADIGKARVSVGSKTYLSGKPVTLSEEDMTVTLAGVPLIYGRDYVIDEKSYRNNVKKGTASVVIRGTWNPGEDSGAKHYGGSKTVKYKIGSRFFLWNRTAAER